MSSFEEREKSFEKKFAHDEELQFKISARKNKYIGQWVSQILGYNPEQEKEYIQSVIKADFAEAGDEDVFRKVKADLKDHNISGEEIRKKMDELHEKSKSDFKQFINFFFFTLNSVKAETYLAGFPSITDADTIKIGNYKIRLFGIDAPEKKQFCEKPYLNLIIFSFNERYPCGKVSTDALKERKQHAVTRQMNNQSDQKYQLNLWYHQLKIEPTKY